MNRTPSEYIKKIDEEKIFWDKSGFVELWDFSRANLNQKARIEAITQVASICYQNPKALGSETLFNRLEAESMGLPSSSFEFVPVLLNLKNPEHKEIFDVNLSNVRKYGEAITDGWFLTNYRALVYDWERMKDSGAYSFDIREIYNTEEECEMIASYFKVFLFDVDMPTRSQKVRHRVNWQELSRRYVSGKRVPFVSYFSEKVRSNPKAQKLFDDSVELYMELLKDGVKPQEARRVIPQGCMTKIWGGFQPDQLANFFRLRLDGSAQSEIRDVAEAMKKLTSKNNIGTPLI